MELREMGQLSTLPQTPPFLLSSVTCLALESDHPD